jgi:hypothetical protein
VKLSMTIVNKRKQSMLNQRKPKFINKTNIGQSKHSPTEIRIDHGNETSIYTLNIYLFLC